MPEQVTLTTPIVSTLTAWKLGRLIFDLMNQTIIVELVGTNSQQMLVLYPTPAPLDHPAQPTGAALLTSVNTANLATKSLIKRVFERLQLDGYIAAGSITGTPD